MAIRTRIAPTPSGYLHSGNALAFLHTARRARELGASLLLRIDDMDRERVRPEYIQDVFDTLDFLRIHPNEGPASSADFEACWSQRLRMHLYSEMLGQLAAQNAVYACTCTRSQLQSNASEGYPGTCRNKNIPLHTLGAAWRLRTDPGVAVRMRLPDGAHSASTLPPAQHDFIVRKKDGFPAYQLCSLADDVHFEVDYIVRGADLRDSTWAQLYLARVLGCSSFEACTFEHHPLVYDSAGMKLSKSAGAASIKHWRESGATLEALLRSTDNAFYP
ncbi:MAG: tRNA glutamyl-Q synthetase [Chitinophagaceae bacterium]|nr:MAG: tRNA glutamyl-Q synthetase [Chitinophagaceae bacterium]